MTTKEGTTSWRLLWLATGVVIGALGLAAALWVSDAAMGDSPSVDMNGSAAMEMAGTDMDMAMDMPESAGVRLTPQQIRQFGITFSTVEEHPLEARVRAVGVVEADETRLVDVTTKFSGYVDRLYADFTGRAVNMGSPLLDIYSPELVAAQEELLLARELQASVGTTSIPGATSRVDLEATARRRLSLWDISEEQIAALLSTGRPRTTLSLEAPINGVILEKSVVAGSAFQAGQTLFRIADLSTVWVDADLRESEASFVGPGSTAVATLTAYPGESFPGVIDFVYPTVDATTRSVRARVALANPAGRLRPGMFATVQVRTPIRTAVAVPSDAVVWTGERTLLFIREEDGGIRPVEVGLGATMGDHTVVLSGASVGQRVVSGAQYLIDAEANIGAIMRSMMSMMGAGDMAGMDMAGMDMGGMPGMGGTQMDGMEMPAVPDSAPSGPQGR